MKPHKSITIPIAFPLRRMLSALLLTLATLSALASAAESVILPQPLARLAQLSPDERRELRERWQQATPEERLKLRKFFLERMRQMPRGMPFVPLPPEWREAMPFPFPGRTPHEEHGGHRDSARSDKPEEASPEASFGFGFENRGLEEN